jgi:hypothetical protein
MTVEELQAQRDEILQRVGISRQQFGERSVEFSSAKEALSLIDAEISKVTAASQQIGTPNVSYASFSDD